MVPGEKSDVFAREGAQAVGGGREAFFGQSGDFVVKKISAAKVEGAMGKVFDVQAEMIESVGDELVQARIGIDGADLLDDRGSALGVEGVQFQQAVTAGMELF